MTGKLPELRVPLWLKWVLTLSVFVPLVVFGAIWLHHQTTSPPAQASVPSEPTALAAMKRDQAVHRARQPASLAPAAALERAILGDLRARIASHDLSGPAGAVSCQRLASTATGQMAFRCQALAGGVSYPFRGVVDVRSRALTWCKDDNIPVAGSLHVPLSAACTR